MYNTIVHIMSVLTSCPNNKYHLWYWLGQEVRLYAEYIFVFYFNFKSQPTGGQYSDRRQTEHLAIPWWRMAAG